MVEVEPHAFTAMVHCCEGGEAGDLPDATVGGARRGLHEPEVVAVWRLGEASRELLPDGLGGYTVPEVVGAEEMASAAAAVGSGHLPATGAGPSGANVMPTGTTDAVACEAPEAIFVGFLPG